MLPVSLDFDELPELPKYRHTAKIKLSGTRPLPGVGLCVAVGDKGRGVRNGIC